MMTCLIQRIYNYQFNTNMFNEHLFFLYMLFLAKYLMLICLLQLPYLLFLAIKTTIEVLQFILNSL